MSDREVVRDALHLLGKFEEMPSQWPEGPEVFPGALNQAYLALDRICAERDAAWGVDRNGHRHGDQRWSLLEIERWLKAHGIGLSPNDIYQL